MTLQEVAAELARNMDCQVEPGDNPYEITVRGKGYHFVVGTFFGGWQVRLHLPEQKPLSFYGESVDVLELRLKAKLSGREYKF